MNPSTDDFEPWVTGLVDAALPDGIKRRDWLESGIGDDPGMGPHTWGLIFDTPAGGAVYWSWVGSYGPSVRRGEAVEGEPPAPIPMPTLAPDGRGKIALQDIERWLVALIINSGCRELRSVEAISARPAAERGTQPYGINIVWHNDIRRHCLVTYSLAAGEQRRQEVKYRVLEAV